MYVVVVLLELLVGDVGELLEKEGEFDAGWRVVSGEEKRGGDGNVDNSL